MYQTEHDELFASIRSGKPINNGEYMAKSTLLAIMGRMAAYTGQEITWEMVLKSKENLSPEPVRLGRPAPAVANRRAGADAIRLNRIAGTADYRRKTVCTPLSIRRDGEAMSDSAQVTCSGLKPPSLAGDHSAWGWRATTSRAAGPS